MVLVMQEFFIAVKQLNNENKKRLQHMATTCAHEIFIKMLVRRTNIRSIITQFSYFIAKYPQNHNILLNVNACLSSFLKGSSGHFCF